MLQIAVDKHIAEIVYPNIPMLNSGNYVVILLNPECHAFGFFVETAREIIDSGMPYISINGDILVNKFKAVFKLTDNVFTAINSCAPERLKELFS